MTDGPAATGAPDGGARFTDYEILAPAGRGAFSTVYRARERHGGRPVALKVLHAAADADSDLPADAAGLVADRLDHPHIVEVLAAGRDGARVWIAMEWVAGHDLGRYVDPRWLLPAPLVVGIAAALAEALAHAHRLGVTHRDVKPSNVRIHLPRRVVKLGDFGIASSHDGTATATGVLRGTPAYMAPELLQGGRAGAQSDLYALGVVLFELLTGRRPFQAESLGELLGRVARGRPEPLAALRPELPSALHDLTARLLHAEARQRPGDASAVAAELAALADALART